MNNPDEIDIDMDDENENDEEMEEGRLTHLQVAVKYLKYFIFIYINFFSSLFQHEII